MKNEYDFTKAKQGKFYTPIKYIEAPVFLDKNVHDFYRKAAFSKKIKLDKMINLILKKEMQLLKSISKI